MTSERRPPAPAARLTFREMTLDDLDDMAALLGDPEVMRYYPRVGTREDARWWIENSQRSYAEHGYGLWLIARRDTGEFLGNCGLTRQNIEGETFTEVGYLVRTDFQGQGYATEAAFACRDYARDAFNIDYLIAIINPANVPSQRVAEKIGLILERMATYNGARQRIYSTKL
ncbi:GNAT family N-acetyltransferase [Nonomuraea sp. NPDC052129]|uniref:GNAT family N-acetyltransferase n=1 Tax=Nonomuraea sp. NPDC052129 TaxID=3154651 RepID=UPI003433080A